MVNIQQINELTQSVKSTQTSSKQAEGTDAFKDALTQALDKTESSEMQTASSSGLGEITATNAIQLTTPTDLVSGATDELLGLLDAYASQLENPEVSLKQMEQMVEQLGKDSDKLLEEAEALGSDEAQLKNIATEAAVTAQTEYIKFNRGDYVS